MKDPSSPSLAETPVIENTTARQNLEAATSPRTMSLSNVSFSCTSYGNATRLMATKGETRREFVYDAVLSPEASQKEVYDRSVGDAVRRNIFRGYNTTIIAYGQSGSGKTFTMSGQKEADKMAPSPEGSSFVQSFNFDNSVMKEYSLDDDDGIIPRAIHDLFKSKQRHESAEEVSISLTYMEIYNDELRDLLVDRGPEMRIRDAGEEGFFVEGLNSVMVKSAKHARDLMDTAITRRRTSSTKLNLRSSRSHAICTLTVSINSARTRQTLSSMQVGLRGTEIVTAKLTMVDLAGSERIKQSGVTGTAQKESININKDLFVLAKVVSALADKSNLKKTAHVPYRDSKLTSLLRDSLGGKW
jgi:Kinesin motor domain